MIKKYIYLLITGLLLTSCVKAQTNVASQGDCPEQKATPDTAVPSTASLVLVGEKYDRAAAPAGDPEGWSWGNRRVSDDPQDAKKLPFDIEALYSIKKVSSPSWSPDGSKLLFNVISIDFKKGKTNVDVYLINADGKGLRKMTTFEGTDARPQWSPDGKSFMFLSTRKDNAQLWIMPIDGGEPRQITHISTGISDPIWSPNGKLIAFSSRVYPQFGADDTANKKETETRKNNPIQAHMADDLLYRHWTFFSDGTRSHILVLNVETEKVTDVTPGDFESPIFSLSGGGFNFSPDSKEICFAGNREKQNLQASSTNSDLWAVSANGGKAVNLTVANKAYDGSPVYSPDGHYIAYLRQEKPGWESDKFNIALYDRKTGETKIITDGFDDTIYDIKWLSNSSALIFQAPIIGRFPLFKVTVASGKIERLSHIPSVREFTISTKNEISFTYNTVSDPVELFTSDIKGSKVNRISSFNRDLVKKYDIRPVEEMWIEGADGKKVHTFIVKPHGFDKSKKYPLILNVHGGPQYQWGDNFRGDWQVYPAAGYVVAFPNPHGSTGYGQDYTTAISGDYGGKVIDDVLAVTDTLANLNYVNKNKMGAMGWSWGGYAMGWLLGHTDKFKAYVSMMALYDMPSFYGATEELWFPERDMSGTPWDNKEAYRKWSPSSYAKNFKTPTLVITGEKDYRCPYTQSLQMFTALRRQNVPARLIIFSNDGHWPSYAKSMPLYYASHLNWFHRYLGGKDSPYKIEDMVRGVAFEDKDTDKKTDEKKAQKK